MPGKYIGSSSSRDVQRKVLLLGALYRGAAGGFRSKYGSDPTPLEHHLIEKISVLTTVNAISYLITQHPVNSSGYATRPFSTATGDNDNTQSFPRRFLGEPFGSFDFAC
jgi:hypothetical protein